MAEDGFLPAYENDLYRTANQFIFVDHPLQLPITRELLDLAILDRDLSSILALRFDPDPVACLSFDVVIGLFSQKLALKIIAVLVEVEEFLSAASQRLVFGVIISRLDDFF